MMHWSRLGLLVSLALMALVGPADAAELPAAAPDQNPAPGATVTIDMNGFPLAAGGQVTGPGLAEPIPMKIGEQRVDLQGLQSSGTYSVDFFHNAGADSSDFTFTVNAAGTGVESVTLGGEKYTMVADFKSGDATLKMAVFDVVLNANGGQTGPYFCHGLCEAYKLPYGAPNQKFKAIPGYYFVDNLANGGNEDYAFIVDSKGQIAPAPVLVFDEKGNPKPSIDSAKYAVFDGNKISPRAAIVRFRIEGPKFCLANPSHPCQPKVDGNVTEYEFVMPISNAGVNVWVFNSYTVIKSDATLPDGKPMEGSKGDADFCFYPRLRYDLKTNQFALESIKGPANSVSAEVNGIEDDNVTVLNGVKVTATIVRPYALAGQAELGAPDAAKPTAPAAN